MIDWMLGKLEWLSKYGFIDIIFGIGIFTFVAKILNKKIKSDIIGIDFMPEIIPFENQFKIAIKNHSPQPLYLYQAYIKPGYYTEKINNTNFSTFFVSFFKKTWKN